MEKNKYMPPYAEITYFFPRDIITSSGNDDGIIDDYWSKDY